MDAPRRPLLFVLLKAALYRAFNITGHLTRESEALVALWSHAGSCTKAEGFRSRFCFLVFLIFVRITRARLQNQHRLLDGQHAQSFETRIYNFQYLLNDIPRWILRENTSSCSKWYVPRGLELRLLY